MRLVAGKLTQIFIIWPEILDQRLNIKLQGFKAYNWPFRTVDTELEHESFYLRKQLFGENIFADSAGVTWCQLQEFELVVALRLPLSHMVRDPLVSNHFVPSSHPSLQNGRCDCQPYQSYTRKTHKQLGVCLIALLIIAVCIIRYFQLLFGGVVGYDFIFPNAVSSVCCNKRSKYMYTCSSSRRQRWNIIFAGQVN